MLLVCTITIPTCSHHLLPGWSAHSHGSQAPGKHCSAPPHLPTTPSQYLIPLAKIPRDISTLNSFLRWKTCQRRVKIVHEFGHCVLHFKNTGSIITRSSSTLHWGGNKVNWHAVCGVSIQKWFHKQDYIDTNQFIQCNDMKQLWQIKFPSSVHKECTLVMLNLESVFLKPIQYLTHCYGRTQKAVNNDSFITWLSWNLHWNNLFECCLFVLFFMTWNRQVVLSTGLCKSLRPFL